MVNLSDDPLDPGPSWQEVHEHEVASQGAALRRKIALLRGFHTQPQQHLLVSLAVSIFTALILPIVFLSVFGPHGGSGPDSGFAGMAAFYMLVIYMMIAFPLILLISFVVSACWLTTTMRALVRSFFVTGILVSISWLVIAATVIPNFWR